MNIEFTDPPPSRQFLTCPSCGSAMIKATDITNDNVECIQIRFSCQACTQWNNMSLEWTVGTMIGWDREVRHHTKTRKQARLDDIEMVVNEAYEQVRHPRARARREI